MGRVGPLGRMGRGERRVSVRLVDYIAAGQDRGTGAVFMTLMATMLGASATLGVAARAESEGFTAAWWLLPGAVGLALQGEDVAASRQTAPFPGGSSSAAPGGSTITRPAWKSR